jgi:two-component system, LuxR family, response regulator FixJ
MSTTDQTVFIVDDDEGSRDSVRAISTMSLPSQVFDSAEHFLESYVGEPGCLISDLRLPGLHVVELLDRLNTQGVDAGQKT